MEKYKTGDSDQRPWGGYVVTATGEDFCEKELTVLPGKILSLQSHELRSEKWRVTSGVLTVLLDGVRHDLKAGEEIVLPVRSIHSAANLGSVPCVFFERQEGVCREEDITRYVDSYGRATESQAAEASVKLYREITALIQKL